MLRIRTFPWTYSPRTFSLPDNSPSICTWCRTFPPSTIRRSTYKAIYTVNVYKIDRVDRVGSGIRVSAIFQNISRLVGRLGSGVRVSASFQTFAFTSSSYFICREHVNVKKNWTLQWRATRGANLLIEPGEMTYVGREIAMGMSGEYVRGRKFPGGMSYTQCWSGPTFLELTWQWVDTTFTPYSRTEW